MAKPWNNPQKHSCHQPTVLPNVKHMHCSRINLVLHCPDNRITIVLCIGPYSLPIDASEQVAALIQESLSVATDRANPDFHHGRADAGGPLCRSVPLGILVSAGAAP